MPIILQPEQEQFIQSQLATGRYTNTAEVIQEALKLLESRSYYDLWVEDVRLRIDTAAEQLDRGEGIDGEMAIAQLKVRLLKTGDV
jgi:antitoxin ParD1/3/4